MFAYSNNGESMRAIDPGMEEPGEVVFATYATEAQLNEAFPGRVAVVRAKKVAHLTEALEAMYDRKAQERRYDNRYTCALRAGYNGPFYEEAVTFAQWMDECNAKAYAIMNEVIAGQRPEPTDEALLAEMPVMVWP